MTLTAACGWTLLRSVAVALFAVPLCWGIHRQLTGLSGRTRGRLWTLLLVPFLTPSLLTGYAYANFSLSLIRHPGWNEVFYEALVGFRFLAVGVLVMQFALPPPVSASALHAARLGLRPSVRWTGKLRRLCPAAIRGPWRAAFPAAAVIFLLLFQEFEIASLMSATSWTVWLFDAQAGGMNLDRTLRLTLLPGACQLLVLLLLLVFAVQSRFLPSVTHDQPPRVTRLHAAGVWILSTVGCTAVFAIPFLMIGREALSGLLTVFQNRQMLREIVVAGGFGLAGGICAAIVAAVLLRIAFQGTPAATRHFAQTAATVVATGGLMGSLTISLLMLWLFQRPVLSGAYDSPLPAILALTVLLLPRALLLQLLFAAATRHSGVHVADLLRDSPRRLHRLAAAELSWRLGVRRHFLATGILCVWGYLELTPCAILSPPGLTTAPVRLYNLMHYGRSNVLSAMTLLTMLAPAVLFLLLAAARQPFQRLFINRRAARDR